MSLFSLLQFPEFRNQSIYMNNGPCAVARVDETGVEKHLGVEK